MTKIEDYMESGLTTTQIQPTVSDYVSLERKKWVMQQYLSGRYPYQIREEYTELYKLSDASFDKDVLWMNNQLRKKGETEIEAIIERHSDRYNHIYQLAIEKGDLRSATLALKHYEDLYKIHKDKSAPSTLHVNNTQNINLPSMSVDELKELLGKKTTINITPDQS